MTKTRTYYVTYSPRGFRNELYVREFDSKQEADDFRREVDNEPNSWALPASHPDHRACVRNFKKFRDMYKF